MSTPFLGFFEKGWQLTKSGKRPIIGIEFVETNNLRIDLFA